MTMMPIRDVSLFAKVTGHGYPLALMHGGPGEDYTSLLPLEPLADRFTLIFYDHRCNGHSEGAEVTSMTWENLTVDADALREALGFEEWAVLGHSFGGNVAIEYALRYPRRVSRLILMNTGGEGWWSNTNAMDIIAHRGYSPARVEACRRFFNGEMAPSQFLPNFLKFFGAYFYGMGPRMALDMMWEMIKGPRPLNRPEATIFAHGTLLKGWSVMDRLCDIRVPTLVIAGRYDFLYPPEHQAILADRLPNAQLKLIERAGHNPHMERQAETVQAIREFMDKEIQPL